MTSSAARSVGLPAPDGTGGEVFGPRVGELVDGRFLILDVIADGGMGRVLRALDLVSGAEVALKRARPDPSDQGFAPRLEAEARLLVRARHPNVVQVIVMGQLPDGAPYYVMELLRGRDLADILEKRGPLPVPRALSILRQLAGALDHAHGQGVIHRDLKPENVLTETLPDGTERVKLIDFGVARSLSANEPRLTRRGLLAGTPAYMSPELVTSSDVGPASDRYSLAVMAFELLTGQLPRPAHHSPARMLQAIVETPPRMPSHVGLRVDGLDDVFTRALASSPSLRFGSAEELVDAMHRCFTGPGRAAPVSDVVPAMREGSSRVAREVVEARRVIEVRTTAESEPATTDHDPLRDTTPSDAPEPGSRAELGRMCTASGVAAPEPVSTLRRV